MLRDFKFLRRNSSKKDEIENVPVNPDGEHSSRSNELSFRAPLNAIQDPAPSPKPEADASFRTRIDKTPSKARTRQADSTLSRKTPDKNAMHSKYRFGWAPKNDPSDEFRGEMRAGGLINLTPGVSRGMGRAYSGYSETASTQSTPTKSVSKPPTSGFRSRIDGNGALRGANFSALYKGMPSSCGPATVVNTVEVPHFDLKEDPSFWLDHNVQVIIRVRPLSSMEKGTHGYCRCLKQENSQSITWIGQPETRFTFDHVACETVDQEMLFRMAVLPMVENCLSGYNSCLFAYGQTGSGKTYTMLGETEELEVRPSPHRGMTPRIFEFLFARIQAEEESRRDEQLKYSCKCSFLEIYNEQITDLLDPSSSNLQLREDVKKGVYVENLSEFEVQTVSDVLKLLTQGSLNRKVAATNMNRESSRSHCVFTCVIESRWEKDSTTNLRFARLNLVDLAGSERQKTSGAEGERLKEAANINRSLSTLGHVIMILVDVANGRLRHVPYRDSKLTFLLQDSLGGNSKTMIIANISPSICSAAETLNTLKFAQRARLIQNNAVVNEDSTGDVLVLQRQIQILKEELSALKRQNVARSLTFGSSTIDSAEGDASDGISYETNQHDVDKSLLKGVVRMSTKQLESLEAILAGSLRREQMAEMSIKKLDAEIEQLNRLVRQREEETRSTKMMLRFREEKIQRMESVVRGSLSAESYLLEENKMLSEECHLLQSKVDKNPEVTRFALENIRLLDQLRRYQEFYEEGEREILKDEISGLRDQLLQFTDGNSDQIGYPNFTNQSQDARQIDKEDVSLQSELKRTLIELEERKCKLDTCLQENAKLNKEIFDLRSMLNILESRPDPYRHIKFEKDLNQEDNLYRMNSTQIMKNDEEIVDLHLELDIIKIILQEERSYHAKMEEEAKVLSRNLKLAEDKLLIMNKQCEHANSALKEAKSVIEAYESQHMLSMNEIEELKKSNSHHINLLNEQKVEIVALKEKIASREVRDQPQAEYCRSEKSTLQVKLKWMQESLEKAKLMNTWYQNGRVFQSSNEEEVDKICRQAEAETAEVIVCMQEELATLQQQIEESHLRETEVKKEATVLKVKMEELDNTVHLLTEANEALLVKLEEKDSEIMKLSEEWELLASEVEDILASGHDELINASAELDYISSSFPEKRIWICEQVGRMMRITSEKDVLIHELSGYLEDANNKRLEMECKLTSLRGAAFAINEAQEHARGEKEREILELKSQLGAKTMSINRLEDRLRDAEHCIKKTSTCATAAFLVVSNFSQRDLMRLSEITSKDIQLSESADKILKMDALLKDQAVLIGEVKGQVCSLTHELEKEKQICAMLEVKLSEEQQHADTMKRKLEDTEVNEFLKTQEKLFELKTGVSMLRSCMTTYVEQEQHQAFDTIEGACISLAGNVEALSNSETNQDDLQFRCPGQLKSDAGEFSIKFGNNLPSDSCDLRCADSRKSSTSMSHRDLTHDVLREELESAVKCIKEVKADMTKVFHKKEASCTSGKRSVENIKDLTTLVLALQEAMSGFGKRAEVQVEAINHKLEAFEQTIQEARTQYYQTKESLESEVGDAKASAAEKAAEASCILAKFEEAQYMMKEADAMIKGLMIANETLKLDVERLKQIEATLVIERDALVKQVQSLQCTNLSKDMQLERLEKQFGSDLAETRDLVTELEDCIAQMQANVNRNLSTITSDCHWIRPVILETSKLVRTWLEDIWSEIIVKDSAVSALHLCHMGLLLEAVTGMNAENGLLQHGLSQSDTVIASLREQNSKSKRELETCTILKGKLLADIKNSFDRILQKEEEAEELTGKLAAFEKKISHLRAQEEMMLQRSNYMGSELAILMKELDFRDSNFTASLLEQEENLKEKEDVLNSQLEISFIDCWAKEFESLILALTLEEKVSNYANKEKVLLHADTIIDKLKEELIFSKVEAITQEQFLVVQEVKSTLLQEEIDRVQGELNELQAVNGQLLQDLERKNSEYESSQSCTTAANIQNRRLQDRIFTLETCISCLQNDLGAKTSELIELQHSQAIVLEDLQSKNRDLQIFLKRLNNLKKENALLSDKVQSVETNTYEGCARSISCLGTIDIIGSKCANTQSIGLRLADKMLQDLSENSERMARFAEDVQWLEHHANLLEGENQNLQAELLRKDEVLKGLLFDLSLLQESASNTKDQKDEMAELVSSLEALEDELVVKSNELDEVISYSQKLENELQEKIDVISNLQSDISKERDTYKLVLCENHELRANMEDVASGKCYLEEELRKRERMTESMETERSEMVDALGKMNGMIESLTGNLNKLADEKDKLQLEVLSLEEKLEEQQTVAKTNVAIAAEAHQIAESKTKYAEDKEAEVRLLEKSIEELECTIDVLESKVEIIKGEAERQRLQREELELELDAVRGHMQNAKTTDTDMKRYIDEKEKDLEQALEHIQTLEREMASKDSEIAQCKAHISELNLHAEAQANEYKLKFKELQVMAKQVKPETNTTNAINHSSSTAEKNAMKPRGSGSPFKCIGLGLAQQIKSEKDEDLTAARCRIEELESLAVTRQKEIFALNARLAAAESMTHDVIRDLLGVKLDMTSYASLLDNQQLQQMAEKVRLNNSEPQIKDQELAKLKQQLNDFIDERQGWLEEIDRRQAELIAAQIALEKLRQHNQLLKTENEMLKTENLNFKKQVMELEGQVNKLSGQQNLHQKIHHHAKIKEENNILKHQNEELSGKLRRAEIMLCRIRDELAHYRASVGRNPCVNFDEEQRLSMKLKEVEDDRVQLAHKLLRLCTGVLNAAGITKPHVSDISPAAAEGALEQIKSKFQSMERELQNLAHKNKIANERVRLLDLVPQTSSTSPRIEVNCRSPRRASPARFLSAFDR